MPKTKKPIAAKTTKTKPTKTAKAAKHKKADDKLSALDAAAKVLEGSREPMNCKALVKAMAERGLWKNPGGATPWVTLCSARSTRRTVTSIRLRWALRVLRPTTPLQRCMNQDTLIGSPMRACAYAIRPTHHCGNSTRVGASNCVVRAVTARRTEL
jgi:hypothetical protein